MNVSVSNLRPTIVPRSDQINAEQLLSGPMTIRVSGVRMGSAEQPVIIDYEGADGHPYKPCLTMRKVLIFAWGEDGREWVGKSMTLYNDPTVRFGGAQVGGIRISHMSHIEREIGLSLTATKGKKAAHTIKPLVIPRTQDLGAVIDSAESVEQCKSAFETAYKSTRDTAARAAFKARYDARMAELAAKDQQRGEA